MPTVYLALGSNLGDREENIRTALAALEKQGVQVQKLSTIIETDPFGGPPQDKYLNAVAEVQTKITPKDLLTLAKNIEKDLGRKQTVRNGPRPIDIDILLYDDIY